MSRPIPAKVGGLPLYISQSGHEQRHNACSGQTGPRRRDLERIVIDQIRHCSRPMSIVQTWRAARKTDKALAESDVRSDLLEELRAAVDHEYSRQSRTRRMSSAVERSICNPTGIDLRLRVEGLTSLCSELSCVAPARTGGGMTARAQCKVGQFGPAHVEQDGRKITVQHSITLRHRAVEESGHHRPGKATPWIPIAARQTPW